MSFRTPSTPQVQQGPVAKQYLNTAGIENEINAARNRKGYLSTFFGRTEKGAAERDYSKIFSKYNRE